MPGLTLLPIEATYLAWIDCSALPVDNPHQFFERAGVGLLPVWISAIGALYG